MCAVKKQKGYKQKPASKLSGRAIISVLLSVKTVSNEIMHKENNLIHLQHIECNENHDSA